MGERPLQDEQLMVAYQHGDVGAFEELVRRHRAGVYQFIVRFVGSRARAEELLQETWLKVVRSAPAYEKRAKFSTWLYAIARNLSVDALRKEKHRAAEPLDEEPPALAEPAPDRAAHNAALRPVIEWALSRLPEEQREVFVLREYSGVGFKEIAELTGVSEGTVKSRMRYALEGLRKSLAEKGVEGDLADEPSVKTA